MKFGYHRYVLHPQTAFGVVAKATDRSGALFRIEWPDGKVGYADLFPWPELGDLDLDSQLASLGAGKITALVEQTIWAANRDAQKRAEQKNVFTNLTRVKNHFLIPDLERIETATLAEAKAAGFTTLKTKVGRAPESELQWIDRTLRQFPSLYLRLDFNSSMTLSEFKSFMNSINSTLRSKIEFVEDPIPYDESQWHEAAQFATLALDHEYEKVNWKQIKEPVPFKVMILKPARQDVKKFMDRVYKHRLKLVITSALDHPVGVAHASWFAGETKKFSPNLLLDCGCLSNRSYKSEDFSAQLQVKGPFFNTVLGTGIGFDMLFGKISWTPLVLDK